MIDYNQVSDIVALRTAGAMRQKFVYLSPEDVPALPAEYFLALNADERIVTLLGHGRVCAQCRFSRSAFRLLFVLLRAPYGADYAELLACLRCSEAVFRKLLMAPSYEQMLEILAPQIARWHKHLERCSNQGQDMLEKELKIVRRAAKERQGVNPVLQKNGFALTVRALYRKGYLLTRVPLAQQAG
jgi:hypothetical protein